VFVVGDGEWGELDLRSGEEECESSMLYGCVFCVFVLGCSCGCVDMDFLVHLGVHLCGCVWVCSVGRLMDVYRCVGSLMDVCGCVGSLMDVHGCVGSLMDAYGCVGSLMDVHRCCVCGCGVPAPASTMFQLLD